MTISADLREQVRQRALCACEFCGVHEDNAGATLTIDHFQPRSKGGSDDLDNLVYACPSCNQYSRIIGRLMRNLCHSGIPVMTILLSILPKLRMDN